MVLIRSPLGGLLPSPLGGLANACCCNDTRQCCCLPPRTTMDPAPPLHITITGVITGSGTIDIASSPECDTWEGVITVTMSVACDGGWIALNVRVECLRKADGIHALRVTITGGGAACSQGDFEEVEEEHCVPLYWRGRWGIRELFEGGCGTCLGDVFRIIITE